MEPGGSLPHSQELATCPYPEPNISPSPRPCETFRKILRFCHEELLAPRPTPKLWDHRLLPVRNCLFNTFATTLHICRPFLYPLLQDAPWPGDRDPRMTVKSYCGQRKHIDLYSVCGRHNTDTLTLFCFEANNVPFTRNIASISALYLEYNVLICGFFLNIVS
jgi:hypothetical protein